MSSMSVKSYLTVTLAVFNAIIISFSIKTSLRSNDPKSLQSKLISNNNLNTKETQTNKKNQSFNENQPVISVCKAQKTKKETMNCSVFVKKNNKIKNRNLPKMPKIQEKNQKNQKKTTGPRQKIKLVLFDIFHVTTESPPISTFFFIYLPTRTSCT